jgi:uncharacterized protein (DUF58 family)
MKTRNIVAPAISAALLASALFLGSALLLRLFFVAASVNILSYLWSVLNLSNLSSKVGSPPGHLQVGDMFQREIFITNNSRFYHLWLKLRDNTNLPGPQDSAMVNIPGQQSHRWLTTFRCQKRGQYHIGPTSIVSTDPFGIFTRGILIGKQQEIIVYPTTVDLALFRFASYSDFGFSSGYQAISHMSPNASSVREYVSGDSLHHIHWRTTARVGSLMVKKFDVDRSYNASKTAWVLLDMNEDSHFGRDEENSDEYAVTIAASLVRKYIESGMRVGLMASDDRSQFFPAERSELHLWNILEALALIKTDWNTTLYEVVSAHTDVFHDNPFVIIVSTSATKNIMETVHLLKNRIDSVVVVLLDIASFQGRSADIEIFRALTWVGAQIYMVRKGEEISKALDSRATHIHPLMV